MLENQLNGIVGASLNWAWKIPDGQHLKGTNPFDGIGVFKSTAVENAEFPVYWESKNLKKPQSFNFKDLQPHQITNLEAVQKHLGGKAMVLFLVCVDYGRMQKRVYVFKDMKYISARKAEQRNILKKEFDKRRNYVLIKKQQIDFEEILAMPPEWEYEE